MSYKPIVIGCFLTFLFSNSAIAQCQYEKSKTITVNSAQVSGSVDLIDFPMLISFTDSDVTAAIQSASGYDVRFMLKDCQCWLDHQIESYNSGTGAYSAWVRIPRLSPSTDTEIEMYYGNASIVTDPSTNNVWTSDYVGVWHLNEDPQGAGAQHLDASGTGNNGTAEGGASIVNVPGVSGNGVSFDGANDWIEIPDNNTLDFTTSMTLSLWFDLDGDSGDGDNPRPLSKGQSGNNGAYSIRIRDITNPNRVSFQIQNGGNQTATNNSLTYNDGKWHYVVCTYDGTTMTMYFDGAPEGTNATTISANNETRPLQIGAGRDRREWNGKIDEVRVSNAVKTADWIATEFANINAPGAFAPLGAQKEADCTGPGGIDQMDGTTNLVLWLKADCGVEDANNETVTDGNAVAIWRDQSGFGIDATEGTSQPDYQENQVQSNPALNFTAANGDRIRAIGVSDASEYMIFIVAEPNSYASNNIGLIHAGPTGTNFSGNTATKSIGMWVSTTGNFWGRIIETDGTQVNYTQSSTADLNEYFIMTNYADGGTETGQYIRGVDASVSSSYDGTVQSWDDFGIGRQGTESWDGHIAEVIVYNRHLNESERSQVENYLASKYGAEIPRLTGTTGPAGIGEKDGTSRLEQWYDAYDLDGDDTSEGTSETGQTAGTISTWEDKSGNNYDLATGTATFSTSNAGLNNKPTVDFNGSSEYLQTADISLASASAHVYYIAFDDGGFNGTSSTLVNWRTTGNVGGYTSEGTTGTFNNYSYYSGGWNNITTNGFTTSDPYIYNTNLGNSGRSYYRNGSLLSSNGTTITLNNPSAPFVMGRNIVSSSDYFSAEVGEFISFSVELNGAENEIIQQYLSAKFNITLSGTDYYTGHAADYTIGVQGIGTSDGTVTNSHVESEASDGLIITMANGSFDAANEYVFVGHNEPNDGGSSADLSGLASVETRFARVWYLDETGTVDIKLTFDIIEGSGSSEFPAGTGYVLLYSPSNGPFAFVDWTADNSISPSVNEERVSFVVTSTYLADGYYTIGSTDEAESPLPVQLVSFDAKICNDNVCLNWVTASELNNDYFTIERSFDGNTWNFVTQIDGNGTTSKKIYYNYMDQKFSNEVIYYKLSQTDYDGTIEDHGIRVVSPIWSLTDLKLMPNPNEGHFVIKSPNSLDQSIIKMQIFNSIGRSVNFKSTILNNEIQFDISNNPLGIYLLNITLDGQTKILRIKKI